MKRIFLTAVLVALTIVLGTQVHSQGLNGYTFSTSTGTFNSIVGQAGNTVLFDPATDPFDIDDDYYTGIDLGFTFNYLGTGYTTAASCANGFLMLGGNNVGGNSWTPDLSGSSGTAGRPVIAPFWSDLQLLIDGGTGGSTHAYRVDGSAGSRVFTIEWNQVEWTYGSGVKGISFQIKLYEASGAIEYYYQQEEATGSSQNIGVGITSSATGSGSYLNIVDNNYNSYSSTTVYNPTLRPASNTRISFVPFNTALSTPSAFSATNVSTTQMTLNWTNNAATAYANVVYISTDATNYVQRGYVSTTGTGTYSLTVTGLSLSTTYYYRIYAVSGAGTSAALSASQATAAGTLSGTRQIPSTSYPTIKSAIDSLTTYGLAGAMLFELQSSYTSTSETYPLTFTSFGGSSTTNTVTFRPASGASGLSVTGANATTLIYFNGAKNVKIDGRPGGTGTTSQLTISNTSTTATAGTVQFANDATNDVLRYCTILGSSTSTTSGVVKFGAPATNGNTTDTLSNCSIGPTSSSALPAVAIYASGSTTVLSLNNVVDNCSIYDYFIASTTNYGINSSSGYTKWRITNNSFYQTATRTHTSSNTIYNVYISASLSTTGNIISGNYIGGSQAGAGGSVMTHTTSTSTLTPVFYGIYCANNSSTTDTTTVNANTITNIHFTTASTSTLAFQGLYVIYGNLFISNNLIGSGSSTGSITLVNNSTSTGPTFNGIYAYPNSTGSQITLNGNTVGGVNLSTATPASSGNLFIGIFLASTIGANSNVTNNIIGSASTSNSINCQTAVTSTTTQSITGIQLASSASGFLVTCSGNTIANLVNNGISTTSGANYVRGIYGSSGVHTISNNTIRNLSNAAPNTSTTNTTMSVVGVLEGATTVPSGIAGHTISNNSVHTLLNTHSTASNMWIVGISVNSSTSSGSNVIRANSVHSFTQQSSASTVLVGIVTFGGPVLMSNNVIRLGVDASGSSLSNAMSMYGIYKGSSGVANILHNTVYIGGSNVTGTSNTFCLWRPTLPTVGTDIIRNNIFQNARANSSGTGAHVCVMLGAAAAASAAVATSQITLNNNLYYHGGTGGWIGAILYTPGSTIYVYNTMNTWSGASSQDGASGYAAPGLVFPNGTSANVNLHITGTTAARGGGTALSNVTDDLDGDSRPSSFPDIGADQCNSCAANDIFPPSIVYTALGNGVAESVRTASNISITDYTGVNTTSGTRPRFYFKKSTDADQYVGNTSTDNGWKWVEASGTTSPFTFNVNYSLLQTAIAVGDQIQYFVIAQDLVSTPNTGVNACAFTSFPTSVNIANTSFPTANYRSYSIANSVGGTINVGPSESISSITNTGGLFEYINGRVVTSNITALVTGNMTSETGTVALNETAENGSGGYTITIRPAAGTTDTISGSNTGGLIKLNGADRVIIDGRNPGNSSGRNLSFVNNATTSASATIQVVSLGATLGAVRDTIRFCNISTGATGSGSVSTFGIYVGAASITTPGSTTTTSGGSGEDNDFLCIDNNFINKCAWGVYARGTSSGLLDSISIINNVIGAPRDSTARFVGWAGIEVQQINNSAIAGNTIQHIITGNTNPKGILIGTGCINSVVANNFIRNIRYTGTGGYGAKGIDIYTASTACNMTIANNMITGMFGDGWSTFTSDAIVGIRVGNSTNAVNGGVNIYNNTVVLRDTTTPTTSSSYSSAALYVGASSTNLKIQNNIFVNSLRNTAVNQVSYAFVSDAAAGAYTTLNFNDYYVAGTQGVLANFQASQKTTLAALQASTTKDQNSFTFAPSFISDSSNLHLSGISAAFVGQSISGLTSDFDLMPRYKPYVGADEVKPVLTITQQPSNTTLCVGQTLNLTVAISTPITFDDGQSRTTPTPSYQWYKGSSIISGANAATYTISSVATSDAASYYCRINASSMDSVLSNTATVTVNTLPAITQEPVGAARCLGTLMSFSGTATGTGVGYQWQKLVGSTWTDISGQTNSTFTIAALASGDFGSYRFVASGTCTPAVNSATATVTQLSPTVISVQPTATPSSLCVGASFTLSVTASASNIGYQWRRNGNPITGATNSTLTITNAQLSDFASYTVLISGDCGAITSNAVIVSQIAPTIISSQPSTSTPQICLGQPFSITVAATGANLSYQWRRAGTPIATATNSTYSVVSSVLSDFASYDVIVTGTCGALTSASITIVQIPGTVITSQPATSTTLCQGSSFNPAVGATGANLSYQWQKQSGVVFNPIVGATNSTYSIGSVVVADAGVYRVVVTGTCGVVNSSSATLIVNTPIAITQQPQWSFASACTGESTTLSMSASGTVSSYQWQKFNGASWADIAGATTNTYAITSLVLSDAGSYRMVLNGPCSATTISNQAALSVQQNVQVSSQPQAQIACVGGSISFTVSTIGTVVGYQWEQDRLSNGNWTPISGATNVSYTKSGVGLLDSGMYRVKVTGNCSAVPVISQGANATIQSIFNIITQPSWPSTPNNVGQVVTLTVNVSGTANFQWQRDQQRNGNWGNVGTNSSTYSYTVTTVADSGNFRCVVSGPCGAVTQNTNTVQVFTCQAPAVTSHPVAPQPTCVGGAFSLSVVVNGQGQAISYQWQHDAARNGTWTPITGATNSTYSKSNIQLSDDGNYRVQIISACSSNPVFSNAASFVVLSSNNVLTQPVSQTACAGANITMSIVAGGANPSYQWYYNGAPMNIGQNASAQTATLQLNNITSGSAGSYSCFVTGPCSPNGIFSNSATLTVNSPVIQLQPQSQTGCVGASLSFVSQASGSGVSYQWQKNQVNINGATAATYTISNPVSADAGTYRVIVSNVCGGVTSNNAVLTMTVPASFATQPQSQSICRGSNLSLSVVINADATSPSYQWRRNGSNLSLASYPTANNPTLLVNNIQPSEAGSYTCVVFSSCQPSGVSSAAAQIVVNPNTEIVSQPIGGTICEGNAFTFNVGAVGSGLTYQWLKDGALILGATNYSYMITSPVGSDAGSYTVVVGGLCSPLSVTSSAAVLVVNTNPRITAAPLNSRSACIGSSTSFSTSASGTGLSYLWRFNGVPIVGNASATTSTLTLSNITTGNAGNYDCVISGTCAPSGVSTNIANLVVNTPIAISSQPLAQIVCERGSASFSVANSGTGSNYQWRFNGFPILNNASALTSALMLTDLTSGNAGVYDVVISGTCNSVVSSSASLTVQNILSITKQPDPLRVCQGSTITTSVAATGTIFSYQWQKDGVNIPGQVSATLTLFNSQASQSGGYRCIVNGSTACGTSQQVSNTVEVIVGTLPTITRQPSSVGVSYGSTVSVQVEATGLGYGVNNVLQYAWFKDGVRLVDNSHISGSSTSVLTIRGVIPADISTNYVVVATGICGSATSTAFGLFVPTVNITGQPQSAVLCSGGSTVFTVIAIPVPSTSQLFYQWFRGTTALVDGANISGATTSSLTVSNSSSADVGDYSCQVTAQPGGVRVTSSIAKLSVNRAPSITSQPRDMEVCVGSALSLNVISGGGSLRYQWLKDGTTVNGATDSLYSVASATVANAGSYTVSVRNDCGDVSSSTVVVTVKTPPSVSTQPVSQTVGLGSVFTVSTVAVGSAPLSYQWQKNGTNISGATNASYTKSGTTASDDGVYTCVVTNSCSSVTTSGATITVTTTSIVDAEQYGYSIQNPQPNPMSDLSTIRITVPNIGRISLDVTDLNGRVVATLVDGMVEAGEHVQVLNASGNGISSGTYLIRLITAEGFVTTRRVVIIR